MDQSETSPEDVEKADRAANSGDGAGERRAAAVDAATQPTSGAAIQHAYAGAQASAEGRAVDRSETSDALKRAAESDNRP